MAFINSFFPIERQGTSGTHTFRRERWGERKFLDNSLYLFFGQVACIIHLTKSFHFKVCERVCVMWVSLRNWSHSEINFSVNITSVALRNDFKLSTITNWWTWGHSGVTSPLESHTGHLQCGYRGLILPQEGSTNRISVSLHRTPWVNTIITIRPSLSIINK